LNCTGRPDFVLNWTGAGELLLLTPSQLPRIPILVEAFWYCAELLAMAAANDDVERCAADIAEEWSEHAQEAERESKLPIKKRAAPKKRKAHDIDPRDEASLKTNLMLLWLELTSSAYAKGWVEWILEVANETPKDADWATLKQHVAQQVKQWDKCTAAQLLYSDGELHPSLASRLSWIKRQALSMRASGLELPQSEWDRLLAIFETLERLWKQSA
jgi:hypothetical protein